MSFGISTGRIDIAISRNTFFNGSLLGYVNDTSGNPIEGALVRVYFHGTYEEDYSDEYGYYHVTNIPICYCLKNASCSKDGFIPEWVLLSITENTTYDFVLTPNNPPGAPTITGPSTGKVGQELSFTLNAVDPDNDDVYITRDDGVDKIVRGQVVEFYPGTSSNTLLAVSPYPHNFSNQDTISISGLNTTSSTLEGFYQIGF
jgi:hypothetical protein